MMLYPSIDTLVKKADSRYTLVIATAKRARQIMEGADVLLETEASKPVTKALAEINEDKIKYNILPKQEEL